MIERLERPIRMLARALALLGGLALVFMIVLTVVSVTGRGFVWAGLGPVPGDYELAEMAAAFAIFAFLPWCQLERGHVTVDLFLSAAGPAVNRAIDVVADIVLTLVAALIAWRLWAGMTDKLSYNETSFILQVPVWWGYAAAMTGAAMFLAVSAFSILRSASELAKALDHRRGG
jgi:TRAP-type C4-dicarboxylate transport system permease small subunit